MSRTGSSSHMFDEESIRTTQELLPRLIRIIFYGLGITNDDFLRNYYDYLRHIFRDKTRKEYNLKAAADRKSLMDPRKITFNMARNILSAQGYDVVCVEFRIQNRITGEVKTFSTDQTVEDLKEAASKENEVGVHSFFGA